MTDPEQIGVVRRILRFPVKSMRGEDLEIAEVRWPGIAGDRRYGFVRSDDRSDFPWLTGRQIPAMLLHAPYLADAGGGKTAPVRVVTPEGDDLPVESPELLHRLGDAAGGPIHLMHCNRGAFDSQGLSVVTAASLDALDRLAGRALDPLRFRINLVVETRSGSPWEEEGWGESMLAFGDELDGARIRVTNPIERCVMINIDPDTAEKDARVLRTVARQRGNELGMYATTERTGAIRLGDAAYLSRRAP